MAENFPKMNEAYLPLKCLITASSALHLGAILNSRVTNKKLQIVKKKKEHKNIALNRTAKKTHIYRMRAKTKTKRVTMSSLSWEWVCWVTQVFHPSVQARE